MSSLDESELSSYDEKYRNHRPRTYTLNPWESLWHEKMTNENQQYR